MSKIKETFKMLKMKNKKALVPFITGSYPNKEESIKLLQVLEEAGADIIEIGVPYSDPLADGEIIEKSYLEAIKNGAKIEDIFYIIKERRKESSIPLVVMAYFNLIYSYGIEKFLRELKKVEGDGIIIPDLPLEERKEILDMCNNLGLDLIPLVARTSKERIEKIVKDAKGFIYCVSVNGITGERESVDSNLDGHMEFIKSKTEIPRLIGFGISNKKTVENVKDNCDGVIIGTSIIKRIKNKENGYNDIRNFIKEIRECL